MAIMNKCKNFLVPDKCDDRIIEGVETKLETREIHSDIKATPVGPLIYEKTDMICSECQNFEKRK